jgi:hypothetical protein
MASEAFCTAWYKFSVSWAFLGVRVALKADVSIPSANHGVIQSCVVLCIPALRQIWTWARRQQRGC